MAKQQVEANITASPSAENTTENKAQEEKKAGSGVGILKILQDKGLITEDQIKAAATQARATGDSVVDVLINEHVAPARGLVEVLYTIILISKRLAEVTIDQLISTP